MALSFTLCPALSFLLQFFAVFKMTWSQSLEFESILPENPKEYDNLQPPKQKGEATTVRFHITVLSLDTIDEGSMTYVADIFMSQSWKDDRLRLPENMTMKYRLLPVNWLKRMWRPDSFFRNAKRVTFQEMTIPNHYIWLYSDKTILYMVKLTLLLSCAMKFESYPHDTQTCTLKIESLSYTTDDLVFDWEEEVPLVVDDAIELPQHNLVDSSLGDCTKVYSTGNFTCIEVVFTLKRRLGYYMFHTYIPTCLIVIMSWISFWIKPEAVPARVTLCVTSLLTLSTQHAQSQKSLPPVSYIKAIDVFMSSCTVFVFASLMEYALVNILLGESMTEDYYNESERRSSPVSQKKVNAAKAMRNTMVVPKLEILHVSHIHPKVPHPHNVLDIILDIHTFCVTSVLILCPQHVQSQKSLPPVFYFKAIDVFMSCTMFVFAFLMEYASVNIFLGESMTEDYYNESERRSSPVSQKKVNAAKAMRNTMVVPKLEDSTPKVPNGTKLRNTTSSYRHNKHRDRAIVVDKISRVLFPLSFVILNISYWSVYLDLVDVKY